MKVDYDSWLNKNAGRPWIARLASLAAAGTATALVALSVVLMAGVGLPAGGSPGQARAPAAASSVRYARALPTGTIVGRRDQAGNSGPAALATSADYPARPASGDAATVGMSATGDNLRQ
jgi:hypothetical protein